MCSHLTVLKRIFHDAFDIPPDELTSVDVKNIDWRKNFSDNLVITWHTSTGDKSAVIYDGYLRTFGVTRNSLIDYIDYG